MRNFAMRQGPVGYKYVTALRCSINCPNSGMVEIPAPLRGRSGRASGEARIRRAGEGRQPDGFSVQVQRPPGFRLPPEKRNESRVSVDEFPNLSAFEPRSFNYFISPAARRYWRSTNRSAAGSGGCSSPASAMTCSTWPKPFMSISACLGTTPRSGSK